MSWKKFATDYLVFTRKDRIGLLVIFILMTMVLFLPAIMAPSANTSVKTDTSWIAVLEKMERTGTDPGASYDDESESHSRSYERRNNYDPGKTGGELFYFDPNTLSPGDWKRLGLRDKTIRTIQNYLHKGGHFRKPEDLQRIYGLNSELFARLAPYIRIEEAVIEKTNSPSREEYKPVKKESREYAIIDINTADTSAFINLPGIGSKLALRIVTFRDKLGGFYVIEQVGETFGLPDSTFQKIKPYLKLENKNIKKININTATTEQLKMHPYIRYGIANPIVAYRNEHGPFQKIEDIKKVMAVTDEVYKKIAPYLTTNND